MSNSTFITSKTKILCVIGSPIEHSMSPIMHNAALRDMELNWIYLAFDIKSNQLNDAIKGFKALDIKGINVTIPHKERIIRFMDEIDPLAKKIGAINAIKNENGNLLGRNTDAAGAKKALSDSGCPIKDKNILIIGAGGAARAIGFALADDCNSISIFNRTEKNASVLAEEIGNKTQVNVEGFLLSERNLKKKLDSIDILINTTPIGMYPHISESPINKELLNSDIFVFDVIYNPLRTKLMKDSIDIGCKALGGLDMLINQGVIAFEWWTNKKPNAELMRKSITEFLKVK